MPDKGQLHPTNQSRQAGGYPAGGSSVTSLLAGNPPIAISGIFCLLEE
jgi:hypothetical protein